MLRVVAAVFAATLIGAGTADTTELVLHLALDDGWGSVIAADLSGNGHDGTLINMDAGTDWVSGWAGLALDFDGINDYVSISDHADLDFGTSDFSVMYWVYKRSATSTYDNTYAVSKWSTGATPGINEWHLSVASDWATDTPSFAVEIGSDKYKVIAPQNITLNEWHHVLGVRRGQTLSIYVDGVLVDESSSLPVGAAVNNTGRELRIAVNQPVAPLFFTRAFFDDVQIYNFALDDGGVAVGQTAGADVAYLYSNPGMTLRVFTDDFESGNTSSWSSTVP
jgi:hypothetical protein